MRELSTRKKDIATRTGFVSRRDRPAHLLTGSIPDIELHGTAVGVEDERVHFYPQRRNIFLFELSRQVSLDEGGLADASVADQDQLEFRCLRLLRQKKDGSNVVCVESTARGFISTKQQNKGRNGVV